MESRYINIRGMKVAVSGGRIRSGCENKDGRFGSPEYRKPRRWPLVTLIRPLVALWEEIKTSERCGEGMQKEKWKLR